MEVAAFLPPPKKKIGSAGSMGVHLVLPYDVIANILSRLSMKVLWKLRYVSKAFSARISDPLFIQSHRSRSDPLAVVIFSNEGCVKKNFHVRISDMEEALRGAGNNTMVKEISNLDFLGDFISFPSRLSLVCMIDALQRTWVLDPATERLTLLPNSNYSNVRPRAFLGFGRVASTGEYKIVSIFYTDDDGNCTSQACEVFTFGSREWRAAQPPPLLLHFKGFRYFVESSSSALVDGEIYALPRRPVTTTPFVNAIACFNLLGRRVNLAEVKGLLCLADAVFPYRSGMSWKFPRQRVTLWFFNKNGDERWVKEYSIDFYYAEFRRVCPLGIMSDGRILLQGDYCRIFLELFNCNHSSLKVNFGKVFLMFIALCF
ncbi:F-box/LRR-repeat/kelch-repeat protein At1g09650-like [Typha latifolia]|uniref:F-box/LRR-repeat/kelch-repeat protein At1g09650-like n=1 Tax=Typha latifolia TaxID=4733 RepID=UPI003C2CA026